MFQRLQKEQGQAMVELALILPILVALLLGVMEVGRVSNAYLTMLNASREGARMAAVGVRDDQVVQRIQNLTATLDAEDLVITLAPEQGSRVPGSPMMVRLTYAYSLTPFLETFISGPFMLVSQTAMRVES